MTKNGALPSRALASKFAGTPPMRNPGSRPAASRIHARIDVVVVLPCVPATASTQRSLQHLARQPFRAGDVRNVAFEQRLDDGQPARHHVADHHHVRRGLELRGLEPLRDLDAERLELRAHGRIDVAIGAGDAMPGGLGDGGDAAHERAADTEDVKVHG